MAKTIRISEGTHAMLVRVTGELMAKLGKQLSFDEAIQELIHEHEELVQRMQRESRPRPGAERTPEFGPP